MPARFGPWSPKQSEAILRPPTLRVCRPPYAVCWPLPLCFALCPSGALLRMGPDPVLVEHGEEEVPAAQARHHENDVSTGRICPTHARCLFSMILSEFTLVEPGRSPGSGPDLTRGGIAEGVGLQFVPLLRRSAPVTAVSSGLEFSLSFERVSPQTRSTRKVERERKTEWDALQNMSREKVMLPRRCLRSPRVSWVLRAIHALPLRSLRA